MADLRSAPAPVATAIEQWHVADYPQLSHLRAELRQAIERQIPVPGRARDEMTEHMTIVATELATNALQHGGSPAIVRLSRSAAALTLDVADESPATALPVGEQQAARSGGRGLQITQSLAQDTGWYVEAGRKHVWAEFRLPRRVKRRQAPGIPVFDLKTFLRRLRRSGL